MGIMIGKAVKLAEGSLDTHSKKVIMNKEFISTLAKEARCSETTIDAIQQITMARQLWDVIPETEATFFSLIVRRCHQVCIPLFPNGTLDILLIDEFGNIRQ